MTDWHNLELDEKNATLIKKLEGTRIDLGGIGKGYAADAALKVLAEHGIKRALVAASGDLAIGDPPPGKAGWEIQLRTFEETEETDKQFKVILRNAGCSTSGDLHQFVILNGKRWSHIVDPKTGLGLTNRTAVSVIAPNSTTCDALATALCVLGPEKAIQIQSQFPDVSWRIVSLDGSERPVTTIRGAVFENAPINRN